MMRDEALEDLADRLQARLNGLAMVLLAGGVSPQIPAETATALAAVAAGWAEEHGARFAVAPTGKMPTPEELRKLALDVGYELKMIGVIAPMGTPQQLPELGAATLEDALIHVRNVDSFLGATDIADDDISALHYLDSWNPEHFLTHDERADLNKRLLHLSQQRTRLHASWNREAIAERAFAAFEEFHRQLTEKHPGRAEWFADDLALAKRALANPIAIALL